MSQPIHHKLTIPSRRDNPFATCWTKPGAIAFRFEGRQSAESLVAKLASQNWMGAIIGPHGSGKSTLLETLKPALIAAGCQLHSYALRDGQRRLPVRLLSERSSTPVVQTGGLDDSAAAKSGSRRQLLIIDGFEQLSWLERSRVRLFCCRRAAGLLVTSHRPIGVRTLITLLPNLWLVEQLVLELCAQVSISATAADVAASYDRHGGNVRDILFDLYDVHERMRR